MCLHSDISKAFLVDSGATDHCVRERSLFHTFRPVQTVVKLADGKTVVSTGKGEVHLAVETTAFFFFFLFN